MSLVQVPRVGMPYMGDGFPCSSGDAPMFVRSLLSVGLCTRGGGFGETVSLSLQPIWYGPFIHMEELLN